MASGSVLVRRSTPITWKAWLTKSGLASTGRTGRSMLSPTLTLNSVARSAPRTTSPWCFGSRGLPAARVVFSGESLAAAGSVYSIVSGSPSGVVIVVPGRARSVIVGSAAATPGSFWIGSTLVREMTPAYVPALSATWMLVR